VSDWEKRLINNLTYLPLIKNGKVFIIRVSTAREGRGKMQIRKTYRDLKPELLYDEVRDLVLKQGATIGEAKLETYSLPSDSSSFISRGTLIFKVQDEKECLRAHIIGSAKGETKMMLDIDEELFPQGKVSALQDDLDFIFGSYEVKPR